MKFGLWNFLVLVILVWTLSLVMYSFTLPSHDKDHLIDRTKGLVKSSRQNSLQDKTAQQTPPSIALPTIHRPPARQYTPLPHIDAPPPIAPPPPQGSVEEEKPHPDDASAVISGGLMDKDKDHHLAQHALPLPVPVDNSLEKAASPPTNPPSVAKPEQPTVQQQQPAQEQPQQHLANPIANNPIQPPVIVNVNGANAPAAVAPSNDFKPETTAIVVLTCKRVNYLEQTMAELLKLPGVEKYQVVVSQDGHDEKVHHYGKELEAKHPFLRLINNDMRQDHKKKGDQASMFYIADHYKFAMTAVFERMEGITHAILLEEDIIVSPDFLRYFEAAAPILDKDATLMAISSWNDNGFKHLDLDPTRLLRSRFFPGLGWMLRRSLWVDELRSKWPLSAWDHWMRTSAQHKGRDCIIPELSRNHNIGAVGATVSQNSFEMKLKNVAHNTNPDVQYGDLSYLLRDRYATMLRGLMAKSEPLRSVSAALQRGKVYRLGFVREAWSKIAEALGIYSSNWPRGAFEHVNLLHKSGATLLLFDRRTSSLAPDADKLLPPPNLQKLPAPQGVNCDQHCASKGLKCDKSWFDFVNDCEFLQQNFQCSRGCGYEVGEDIPNFVSDTKHPMHGYCLITDAIPTCHNKHPSTSRLCACA